VIAFRGRVLVSMLGGVLVLVAVAAALAWRQYDDSRSSAMTQARARAILAGTVFDTYFAGQLAVLTAMAAAPVVVAADEPGMAAYFKRVQPPGAKGFPGGIAWIDPAGTSRVTSDPAPSEPKVNVSDRSYFKAVVATDKPFVSEGITTRRTNERAVAMAVPTHDAAGRPSGVLVGVLLVGPSPTGQGQPSVDLGYAGLAVFDREGQSVLAGFTKARNTKLLEQLRRAGPGGGVLGDTRGLAGAPHHVVAYATSAVPGWTVAIDQPRSTVLESARRSLVLALALIAGVAAMVLLLIVRTVRRARRAAERDETQAQQQRELAGVLASASAVNEVARALAESLETTFEGALAVVALAAEDRLGVRIAATAGEGFDRAAHAHAVTHVAEDAYGASAPIALTSAAQLRAAATAVDAAFAGDRRSLYARPLIAADGDRVGALVLLFRDDRPLDDSEEVLVAAQAEQAAIAIERTRERERDHDAAVRLQRSLLPERLPEIAGLDLAARYNAGGTGLEIGGDWYDVVHRDDGLVHLTVGDVAGRGIGAAALMGQLRNAFRAYALDHASPGEVLHRLLRHVSDDDMATAAIVTLDLRSGDVRYASAGHPPPLVLQQGASAASLLDDRTAPPLGVPEPATIAEGRLHCAPGATILLYTDGLIEQRGSTIDAGIAVVATALAANALLPAEALADAVLERAAAGVVLADDVAILVARFTGLPDAESDQPAQPGSTSVVGAG
jgi:serine phosphatase RsbU (regulator of sigma subunit)